MDILRKDRFQVATQYETGRTLLAVNLQHGDKESIYLYQFEMIQNNPHPSIVPFHMKRKDHQLTVCYDVTGLLPLPQYIRNAKLTTLDALHLISGINSTLMLGKSMLLNERCFVLHENFIYVDEMTQRAVLLYVPVEPGDECREEYRRFLLSMLDLEACRSIPAGRQGDLQSLIQSPRLNVNDMQRLLDRVTYSVQEMLVLREEEGKGAGGMAKSKQPAAPGNGDREFIASLARKIDSVTESAGKIHVPSRNIVMVALTQLGLIAIAMLAEKLLTRWNVPRSVLYVLIGAAVLAADLAIIKILVLRKGSGGKEKELRQAQVSSPPRTPAGIAQAAGIGDARQKGEKKRNVQEHEELQWAGQKPDHFATGPLPSCIDGDEETEQLVEQQKPAAVLVLEKEAAQEEFRIHKSGFIIGRSLEQADMLLSEKVIGRIHAEIIRDGKAYYLLDKHSRNGTYLNEERLVPGSRYLLNHGDYITLANIRCRFVLDEK